ncbi:MAG: sugar phosphate isomerase/epimerase [Clostridia bacterium]|nr:sugar phosphate isomerase/epimerase [Clostridia bacterium]
MKFPVALQLYSVRHEAKNDLDGTLKQVKEMGYDGVEFAGLHDYSPEQVRDLCKKHGLTPISAHVNMAKTVEDGAEATYDIYKTIGCSFVVIPHVSQNYCKAEEDFSTLVKNCEVFGKAAKDRGMQLCYHNHDFEFTNRIDGKPMLDVLYETVDADLLQTQLDTCWVNVGGEDPAQYVRKYAGRCRILHLKDFVGQKTDNMYALIGVNDNAEEKATKNQAFDYRPVGHGVQDIPGILKAAEESGVEWIVVEQDQPSLEKTPLECAKMSIDYLKTINQ